MKKILPILSLTTFLCLGCNKNIDLGEPLSKEQKINFLNNVNENMSLIPDGWYKTTITENGIKAEYTFEIKNLSYEKNIWKYDIANLYGKTIYTKSTVYKDRTFYYRDNLLYIIYYRDDGSFFSAKYAKNIEVTLSYKFLEPAYILKEIFDVYLVENTLYSIQKEDSDNFMSTYNNYLEINYSEDFKTIINCKHTSVSDYSYFNTHPNKNKITRTIKSSDPIEINFEIDERAEEVSDDESIGHLKYS
jgi:hypothetical protein